MVQVAGQTVLLPGGRDLGPLVGETKDNVYVSFFREPIGAARARKLAACETATDRFVVRGNELYWLCRTKLSAATVWASPTMKAIGLPATSTMRNLTTLRKLAERT